jgi:N-acyl-D-amino-acid deacylase
VLGHYSRDLGLFPLEAAVHKMTGLSARQFRLAGRGEIRVGAYADIVVFDAATISDTATFELPKAQAAGIDCVLVNGQVAYRGGDTEPRRSGRFLAREPMSEALADS